MPFAAIAAAIVSAIGITGTAAAIVGGIIATALEIGTSLLLGAIGKALTPTPGLKSTLTVGISANDPRRVILGRAATAGSLVTFQSWGANNEYMVLIFRVADHKVQGFAPQIAVTANTTFGSETVQVSSSAGMTVGMPYGGAGVPTGSWITAIIDGAHITISQQASASHTGASHVAGASVYWQGNPVVLGAGGAVPGFHADGHDNCWVTLATGDWNQAADADMVANSNGRWTSADRGRGVAYVKVKARANAKAFPSGLSMLFQFAFVIDGMALYDRRADSSVGGSGSQRWNDTATWALTSNSAVVAENLLRGLRVEDTSASVGSRTSDTFFGLGLTDADLPFNENVTAMNHCDESVALLAGGTEPRYRCNGVIAPNANEGFDTALTDVMVTMSGKLAQSPGRFILLAGVAQTVVRTFADTDFRIDGPSKFIGAIALDTIFNAVTGQFADPASMYTGQPLPPRISLTDAAADGGYKASTLDLSYVTSATQGQRIQEIARRRQRLQVTSQRAVAPENLDLEAGDWISWPSARFAAQLAGNTTFEIVQSDGKAAADESENLMIVLDLAQTSAGLFSWNPAADELSRFAPSLLPSANPNAVAVTSLTAAASTIATPGGSVRAALLVTTDALADPAVVGIRFEYQVPGLPPAAPQVLTKDFAVNQAAVSGTQSYTLSDGVVAGYQYEVRAAALLQPPQDLNWSSYVTTGGFTSELVTAPNLPINLSSGQAFTLSPLAPLSSPSSSSIAVAATTLSMPGQTISVPSGTVTGLGADTYYAVFYDLQGSAYLALSSGAAPYYTNPTRYVAMGAQWTQTSGGSYSSPPAPPGGGGAVSGRIS